MARRSTVNSPIRHIFSARGRVSRSNSTGHALYVQSPSDVFGSLINDTEEFLEDFQNRNSAGTSVYTPLSSPAFSPPYRAKKRANPKLNKPNTPGQVTFQDLITIITFD